MYTYSMEPEQRQNFLDRVGAFLCSFPASLFELFMLLGKTIIWSPAHRFSLARAPWPWQFTRLIEHVQMTARFMPRIDGGGGGGGGGGYGVAGGDGGGVPHFVTAMGRYDQEYVKYFIGVQLILLPTSS
eukprot:TRINITY_DN2732_c0_g3_i1.p2 TRINITY_DN2732_c0_g3~~TRINITY_DN2732_c0_g3_i1.p2  ORF type:complete len:129 (+),score=38.16 TRINITY_DN2732_c0_g3_i1:525-911(+)